MTDSGTGSILPLAVLGPVFLAALIVFATRRWHVRDERARTRLASVFLLGIACQCAHMTEEFVTGLHVHYPALFGLDPVSAELFVGFNAAALGIWALSAWGVLRGYELALLPIWFFALAMCLNGVLHPVLAIWVRGYFPGLVTAPLAGIMGALVLRKLIELTGSGDSVS